MEAIARSRVPRDPNDRPAVALALTLDVGILTGDKDCLGRGCPTWTVETLVGELGRLARDRPDAATATSHVAHPD